MSGACHGVCDRYTVTIPKGESPYTNNRKYCSTCQHYMTLDSLRCPCCNVRVRTRTRKRVKPVYKIIFEKT
jgi:uncharacterized paraquat-inducible protein A